MKIILTLGLLISTSAFANITCKGAINYALDDISDLNADLKNRMSFEDAKAALSLETGRHRDVILACRKNNGELDQYCQNAPRALRIRVDIIADNFEGTKKEKNTLIWLNGRNRELSRILCP